MDIVHYLLSYLTPGNFLYIDLLAAFTNALNGALLCQRPDHYRGRYITVIGIGVFAVFGGVGGGVSRDVLLNDTPSALTNPWYLILVFVAWIIGLRMAWSKGETFRETTFQIMTSFSLPWYAVVGVEKGLSAGWPLLGAIFLGVVGPTAGRFLIDVGSGVPAKQFVQGEWFVGTAVLTSVSFFFLRAGASGGPGLSLSFVAASLIAFAIGFAFRMAAIWFLWEEPMPGLVPAWLTKGMPKRESLKEKMQPGWVPSWEEPPDQSAFTA
jgi:uncharacterized membrane protein YeiH